MDTYWGKMILLIAIALSGVASLAALVLPTRRFILQDKNLSRANRNEVGDKRFLSLLFLSAFFVLVDGYLLTLKDGSAVLDVGGAAQKISFVFWLLTVGLSYRYRREKSVLSWEAFVGSGLLMYLSQYVMAFRLLKQGDQSYSTSNAVPLFMAIIAVAVVVLFYFWKKRNRNYRQRKAFRRDLLEKE